MRNDYKAENVVRFMEAFIKQEEQFDSTFFDRLYCMFTTVALMCDIEKGSHDCITLIEGLWEDVQANYNEDLTNEDYDAFYHLMANMI